MAKASTGPGEKRSVAREGRVKGVAKQSLITGTAIVLPLAITIFIVSFLLQFVDNSLAPFISFVEGLGVGPEQFSTFHLKLITVGVIVVATFMLGFVAEFTTRGSRLGSAFDTFMASLPGIGSVYTSFDEMSEILLDSDTKSFQDVKLVEYPGEGSYTIAFKTTETPPLIEETTGHDEMVTLFMPMAPNPVMGGFVIHVSTEQVVDVDMTVEEGIRSIVTSGVAIGSENGTSGPQGLTQSEMRNLGGVEQVERQLNAAVEMPDSHTPESGEGSQQDTEDGG